MKFLKYSIVGVIGTTVDFACLIFQVEILHFNLYLATVISFLLAASTNHLLNRHFTFKSVNPNFKGEYLKFLLVSIVGVLSNVFIMYALITFLSVHYLLAKLVAISIVILWNFLANYHWTFTHHG